MYVTISAKKIVFNNLFGRFGPRGTNINQIEKLLHYLFYFFIYFYYKYNFLWGRGRRVTQSQRVNRMKHCHRLNKTVRLYDFAEEPI